MCYPVLSVLSSIIIQYYYPGYRVETANRFMSLSSRPVTVPAVARWVISYFLVLVRVIGNTVAKVGYIILFSTSLEIQSSGELYHTFSTSLEILLQRWVYKLSFASFEKRAIAKLQMLFHVTQCCSQFSGQII